MVDASNSARPSFKPSAVSSAVSHLKCAVAERQLQQQPEPQQNNQQQVDAGCLSQPLLALHSSLNSHVSSRSLVFPLRTTPRQSVAELLKQVSSSKADNLTVSAQCKGRGNVLLPKKSQVQLQLRSTSTSRIAAWVKSPLQRQVSPTNQTQTQEPTQELCPSLHLPQKEPETLQKPLERKKPISEYQLKKPVQIQTKITTTNPTTSVQQPVRSKSHSSKQKQSFFRPLPRTRQQPVSEQCLRQLQEVSVVAGPRLLGATRRISCSTLTKSSSRRPSTVGEGLVKASICALPPPVRDDKTPRQILPENFQDASKQQPPSPDCDKVSHASSKSSSSTTASPCPRTNASECWDQDLDTGSQLVPALTFRMTPSSSTSSLSSWLPDTARSAMIRSPSKEFKSHAFDDSPAAQARGEFVNEAWLRFHQDC